MSRSTKLITEAKVRFVRNDAITAVEALRGLHIGEPDELVIYLCGYFTGKCSYIDEVLARYGVKIDDESMVPDCYG